MRVFIADDHEAMRRSYTLLVAQYGINVVGNAPLQAILGRRIVEPFDILVGGIDRNIEDAESILRAYPGDRTIIASMIDETADQARILSLGARGHISKYDSAETLIDTLRRGS